MDAKNLTFIYDLNFGAMALDNKQWHLKCVYFNLFK